MTHCCLSPPSPPAALSFLCLTNPVPGAGSLPAETLVWLNRRWSAFLPGPSWTPWLASHRPSPLGAAGSSDALLRRNQTVLLAPSSRLSSRVRSPSPACADRAFESLRVRCLRRFVSVPLCEPFLVGHSCIQAFPSFQSLPRLSSHMYRRSVLAPLPSCRESRVPVTEDLEQHLAQRT